jgi:uncharacterized membrane protein
MKSIFQSKTVWLAIGQFVVGFLALFTASFGAYIPASALGLIVMVKSVIDIYMRSITTQPVG